MYDAVIIGCGISGAATAFELSKYNLKTAVLEAANDVSMGATRANSAIIHAGYDPKPGSLMAKLNVRGAELAKEICEKLDVPYAECGALVLAFDETDRAHIRKLMEQGISNGVKGLRIVEKEELRRMEPLLSDEVVAALYAPTSAICLPWEYCFALAETAVKNGVELFLNSSVASIEKQGDHWTIKAGDKCYETRAVINAAGLSADIIHDMAFPHKFTVKPAKGQYFLMDKSEGFRAAHTVFQCPGKLGKGVLVTPTVHGNLLVGPDSVEVVGNDTSTDAAGLDMVIKTAKRSVPSVDAGTTIRNFAGVRARTEFDDFIIEEAGDRFFDVAGICSPGLSSAPAIAEYVAELMKKSGMELEKKTDFIFERKKLRFKDLSEDERIALVNEKPEYGRVICRCETITEGEISDCFDSPIPPVSVDGIKRRAGSGMGRCQGGFCGPKVVSIIAEKLGIGRDEVLQDGSGTRMLIKEE